MTTEQLSRDWSGYVETYGFCSFRLGADGGGVMVCSTPQDRLDSYQLEWKIEDSDLRILANPEDPNGIPGSFTGLVLGSQPQRLRVEVRGFGLFWSSEGVEIDGQKPEDFYFSSTFFRSSELKSFLLRTSKELELRQSGR